MNRTCVLRRQVGAHLRRDPDHFPCAWRAAWFHGIRAGLCLPVLARPLVPSRSAGPQSPVFRAGRCYPATRPRRCPRGTSRPGLCADPDRAGPCRHDLGRHDLGRHDLGRHDLWRRDPLRAGQGHARQCRAAARHAGPCRDSPGHAGPCRDSPGHACGRRDRRRVHDCRVRPSLPTPCSPPRNRAAADFPTRLDDRLHPFPPAARARSARAAPMDVRHSRSEDDRRYLLHSWCRRRRCHNRSSLRRRHRAGCCRLTRSPRSSRRCRSAQYLRSRLGGQASGIRARRACVQAPAAWGAGAGAGSGMGADSGAGEPASVWAAM